MKRITFYINLLFFTTRHLPIQFDDTKLKIPLYNNKHKQNFAIAHRACVNLSIL